MAPWWWFHCKPKHVGVVLLILKCSNNSRFFNVVCISWKLKCWKYMVCAYCRYCSFYRRREEVYRLSLFRSMDHMKGTCLVTTSISWSHVCRRLSSGSSGWYCFSQINQYVQRALSFKTAETTVSYTECHRRNGPNFGRVFLMLNYTDITQNTYIQSWTVTEIMAREIWNFDSCYKLTDYQIHIETGRNMWFL